MIIGYVGNVRNGKTLSAAIQLKQFYDMGYKIYSNTWLSFKFTPLTLDYVLDIVENDIEIPDNSIFFIDEIHIWLDSRIAGSKRNRIISYFLLQTGKMGKNTDYGLILLYTTQYLHQIDKRLKSVTDIVVKNEKIIIKKHVKKPIHIFKQTKYIMKGDKSYMKIDVYIGAEWMYKLYDTRQKIKYEPDRYEDE